MKRLASIVQLAACVLLFAGASVQAVDKKADPTGTWVTTMEGRNGQTRETVFKLKAEGEKLTGTISGMRGSETKIENGTVKGDAISFAVTREFNGNSFTSKYKGKVAGDAITGTISFERNGESRDREWTAKRKTDDAKKSGAEKSSSAN